jgi:Tfp pilus assembly protein FimV
MGAQRQSTIRLLAPASLALFAVVFLIVVVASLGGGDGDSTPSAERPAAASERRTDRARQQASQSDKRGSPRFYTVKPGDNLAAIAQETGVPLEELMTLNPELDPQGLVSGQRVRLRQSGD